MPKLFERPAVQLPIIELPDRHPAQIKNGELSLAAFAPSERQRSASSDIETFTFGGADGAFTSFKITRELIEHAPAQSALRVTFSSNENLGTRKSPLSSREQRMSVDCFQTLIGRLKICEAYSFEDQDLNLAAKRGFTQLFVEAAKSVDIEQYLSTSRIGRFKD